MQVSIECMRKSFHSRFSAHEYQVRNELYRIKQLQACLSLVLIQTAIIAFKLLSWITMQSAMSFIGMSMHYMQF